MNCSPALHAGERGKSRGVAGLGRLADAADTGIWRCASGRLGRGLALYIIKGLAVLIAANRLGNRTVKGHPHGRIPHAQLTHQLDRGANPMRVPIVVYRAFNASTPARAT